MDAWKHDARMAQARDVEFVADRAGDWMLHCHLPHHMMNQMASTVGPMTRVGRGMQAGASMEEGMGMLRDGNATSENRGPGSWTRTPESAPRPIRR